MKSNRQRIIDEILVSRGITQRELSDEESTLIAIPTSCGLVPYVNTQSPFDSQPAKMWQVKKLKELGYDVFDLRVDNPPIISGEIQQLLATTKEEKTSLDARDDDVLARMRNQVKGSKIDLINNDGTLNPEAFVPTEAPERIDVYGLVAKKKAQTNNLIDELNFSIRSMIREDIRKAGQILNDRHDSFITSNVYRRRHLYDKHGYTLDERQKELMAIGIKNRTLTPDQMESLQEAIVEQHQKDVEQTNALGKSQATNFVRPVQMDGMSDAYRQQMNTILNRPSKALYGEQVGTNKAPPNKVDNIRNILRNRR